MAASGSLRDLYTDTRPSWNFVPPNDNGSTSAVGPAADSSSSYQWSARPRPNSIYELSPDLDFEPNAPNAAALFRAATASALLQYLSAVVENPWEVGKTLLQVQYVPRDIDATEDLEPALEEEGDSSDNESTENKDSYFADNDDSASRTETLRPTDERGYVIRQGAADSAARPEWMMPVGTVDGVWGMIKEVSRWKPEGWLGLWKGTATGCMKTFLEASLQPIFHSFLAHALASVTGASSTASFSRAHPLLLPVASHLATGLLLSPLDLIRTRLIVQTSSTRHRAYSGPFDALNKIIFHEGGFQSLYLHPQLLYPAILDCTLTPLVAASAPIFTARLFSRLLGSAIHEDSHPVIWAASQLGGACLGLLVTLPVETVRRRLQVQMRGGAPPIATCVEVRRRPYIGIVDVIYSILVEERSDLPLRTQRKRRASHSDRQAEEEEVLDRGSWLKYTGIGQLYRGLGMRVSASVIIFLLSLVTSEPGESGWTEL